MFPINCRFVVLNAVLICLLFSSIVPGQAKSDRNKSMKTPVIAQAEETPNPETSQNSGEGPFYYQSIYAAPAQSTETKSASDENTGPFVLDRAALRNRTASTVKTDLSADREPTRGSRRQARRQRRDNRLSVVQAPGAAVNPAPVEAAQPVLTPIPEREADDAAVISGEISESESNNDNPIGGLFGAFSPLAGTEKELRSLRDPIRSLGQPLQDLKDPISRLRGPLYRMVGPLQGIESEMRDLKAPMADLKQPLSDLKAPMEELAAPMRELQEPMKKLGDLKEPLGQLQEPLKGLQKPMVGLEAGTKQLRQPLSQMTSQLSSMQAPLNSMSRQLSAMQKPLANLVGPINKLSGPLSGVAQPVDNLSASVDKMPKSLQGLDSSVSHLQNDVRQLHATVGSLRQSLLDISRYISLAVIVGAVVVGVAILMHRKVAAVSQPTQTTVQQFSGDHPIDMTPPVAGAPGVVPHQGGAPVTTVMTTEPIAQKNKEPPAVPPADTPPDTE